MGTIIAQATGNWSATGTWAGGVLPGAGDVAQTSTFTVTIDQDVTCTQLEPTSSGYFVVSTGRTITANFVMSSSVTTGGLRCTGGAGVTVTLNGNVTGTALNNNNAKGVYNAGVGSVVINGNVTGATAGSASFAVENNVGGTMTINGNVTGGSGTSSYGAWNNGVGTMTVNGTVTGGSGTSSFGLYNNSTGTATATTAVGGSVASAVGIYGLNTGGTTKVKAFQCSSQGVTPLGGFIFIDEDAANNTFKMRTADDSAEVTLVHSSLAGGGGPVVGSRIIKGLGAV